MKEMKQVIAKLVKNGATKTTGLVVKSITTKQHDSWTRVVLKVNKDVKQNVIVDDNYEIGTGRTIFVSSFALGALLGDMPECAMFKSKIVANPEIMETLLSYAKIDIIQEVVEGGTEYVNPFSEKEEPRVLDNTTVISHVIKVELGDEGQELVDYFRKENRKMLFAKLMAGGSNTTTNKFKEDKEEEAE